MQAVVLAGGRGTRMTVDPEAPPKPLVALCGLSILEHNLGRLAPQGVTDVVLCTGYRAADVERALGDGARYGVRIRHSVEPTPLGTAGAVRAAEALLEERFLLVYGDVLLDVDVAQMMRAHLRSGALATLAVHPNDHPFDSDRVVTDREGRVEAIVRGGGPEGGALCNAALYVLEKRLVVEHVAADGSPSDFARDVFPAAIARGGTLLAYRTTEYLKDVGTPARRDRVEADLAAGVPARMRRTAQRPAVLVDRDGVLVEDIPFATRPEQLALLPGAAAALRRLNAASTLAVLCTNQPVVARGELSEEGLHRLHRHLEGLLGQEGAWLDELFVCPHHTDRGFAGERADLKIACDCRKPAPGLVHRAVAELGIDRRTSVLVGDRTSDLVAARAGGLLGIGVRTGAACKDGRHAIRPETPIVADLAAAVALSIDTVASWRPLLQRARGARIVAIGGPSRAGKTVAATALVLALAHEGVPALHVSLDRFIQPAHERAAGSTVRERTGFLAAAAAASALSAGSAVYLPGYEPLRRGRAAGEVAQWDRTGVLVVEGVLANDLQLPGALEVALGATDDELRARRAAFYAWKGTPGAALDEAVDGRAEELATVAAACARAHVRLRLDERSQLQEVP